MAEVSAMSEPTAGALEREAERDDNRTRWLLSLPAMIIIVLAAAGPLLVMVVWAEDSFTN